MVARAIQAAVTATQMPPGVFSLLHGRGHEAGMRLIRHAAIKAVGFTGSQRAGLALFRAAAARPEPIPVYAEMGSTNPIFVLPGVLRDGATTFAQGLLQSVTLGVGQFCTNPGLVFGLRSAEFDALAEAAGRLATASPPGTMLYPALCDHFRASLAEAEKLAGVRMLGKSSAAPALGQVPAAVLATDAATFQTQAALREEMFGPSTLLVSCGSTEELKDLARSLPGQLTATIHGTAEDLARHRGLISILEEKAGRLLFNGFPTGVEVCPSMHHGGPYPATTDVHFTSVGTAAIKRFARPVCYQNFPDEALPVELRNQNARGIWRLIDGQLTKEDA